MMIKDVFVLEEAVDDLNEGRIFYDLKEAGVGNYFWDSIIVDMESLPNDSHMQFIMKI